MVMNKSSYLFRFIQPIRTKRSFVFKLQGPIKVMFKI